MSALPFAKRKHVALYSQPDKEAARLRALQDLGILDSPEHESFDRITRMAGRLFGVPVAAVSLTDENRQWFKSHFGIPVREIPLWQAPCAEITRRGDVLVVPDLTIDPRFANSPLTDAGFRFYAGAPLITKEGYALGAICVLDRMPRNVSPEEIELLNDFASLVMAQIELKHEFGRIDPLSGLPNRNQLAEDLDHLERAEPGQRRVGVLIDLADPRSFNHMASVLGAAYVDDLVAASTRTIKQTLGRDILLYHVGFASCALILDEKKQGTWKQIVARLANHLKTSVMCNSIPVVMNVAFGISPFRLGEFSPRDILRTAISAAQDAREGQVDFAVYDHASNERYQRRFSLLTDIREAVRQPDQLALVYQPRIDVRTRQCVSVEALLRWRHPTLGCIPPDEFIPLVEQTALTRPVTEWVVNAALGQVAAWRRTGLAVRVSVNVSALDLEDLDFVSQLDSALQRHAVPASALELDFTESVMMHRSSRVVGHLQQLRTMGIELAIDDFGTGYSSFSYLQRLPANTVKLDQSFMHALDQRPQNQVLVRSIIGMAHDLDYRVVAEGVETAVIYQILEEAGCNEIQGYFISRPLAPEILDRWMRNRISQGVNYPRRVRLSSEHSVA